MLINSIFSYKNSVIIQLKTKYFLCFKFLHTHIYSVIKYIKTVIKYIKTVIKYIKTVIKYIKTVIKYVY